mmetsp:Transcript_53358/g.95772  ORF Transcript_53358/g.95772 Transcript_53358/m.95772 type:complete len:130 (+) Transcript_53358:35-424(+)
MTASMGGPGGVQQSLRMPSTPRIEELGQRITGVNAQYSLCQQRCNRNNLQLRTFSNLLVLRDCVCDKDSLQLRLVDVFATRARQNTVHNCPQHCRGSSGLKLVGCLAQGFSCVCDVVNNDAGLTLYLTH